MRKQESEQTGEILVDARWRDLRGGIARFADEVLRRLTNTWQIRGVVEPFSPLDPLYLTAIHLQRRPAVYFSPAANVPIFTRVPLVFTIHDLIPVRFREETTLAKRIYYEVLVANAARKAAAVLTVSEFTRNEVIDWTGLDEDRVITVGNGVSECFTPDGPAYAPGYPYLLYVGNHRPHKNLQRLLMAFRTSGLYKEVKLLITGPPHKGLLALAGRLDISASIVFTGVLSETELPEYYRGATALLLPSLYEGFGLPVVEAMACGTPVVTSKTTALREVAGEAAILVDPLEIEDIAAAMCRVVYDATVRDQLRAMGFERARHFSWDVTAEKVASVLESAMHAK